MMMYLPGWLKSTFCIVFESQRFSHSRTLRTLPSRMSQKMRYAQSLGPDSRCNTATDRYLVPVSASIFLKFSDVKVLHVCVVDGLSLRAGHSQRQEAVRGLENARIPHPRELNEHLLHRHLAFWIVGKKLSVL